MTTFSPSLFSLLICGRADEASHRMKPVRMNFEALLRQLRPSTRLATSTLATRESLTRFVWRISGWHQLYVGVLAVAVSVLNVVPIELQRRVIDGAIANKDVTALFALCTVLLVAILVQALLKYALLLYQSWVSESAIVNAREELAAIARGAPNTEAVSSAGQTMGVLGSEIEKVGGFVGSSISEAIVNLSFIIFICGYMLYLQPLMAIGCMLLLAPQLVLAPYLQPSLDLLVEKQVQLVRALGDEVSSEKASSSDGKQATRTTILSLFKNRMKFLALKFGLKGLLNVIGALAPLAAILVGGLFVLKGDVTLGSLVAFVSGLDKMATPLRDLLNFYRERSQTKVHHSMIMDWITASKTPAYSSSVATTGNHAVGT